MTVKEPDCTANDTGTELIVTAGETLLFEVTPVGGAQAIFAIVNQHGTTILGSDQNPDRDGVYRVSWPADVNRIEVPNDLNFAIGMHFVVATEYLYQITRRAADESTIAVLKKCKYESNPHDSKDHFHVSFRVFTR